MPNRSAFSIEESVPIIGRMLREPGTGRAVTGFASDSILANGRREIWVYGRPQCGMAGKAAAVQVRAGIVRLAFCPSFFAIERDASE